MKKIFRRLLAAAAAFSAAVMISISASAQGFTDDGEAPVSGWVYSAEGVKYCREDGSFVTGWARDTEGRRYYFLKDGFRAADMTVIINDEIYRFDKNGRLITEDTPVNDIKSLFDDLEFGTHRTVALGRKGQANAHLTSRDPLCYESDAVIGKYPDGSNIAVKLYSSFDKNGSLFAWGMLIPLGKNGEESFHSTIESIGSEYSDIADSVVSGNEAVYRIGSTVIYISYEEDPNSMFIFTYDDNFWPEELDDYELK